MTPDLPRAQAVVAGCSHTSPKLLTQKGKQVWDFGACAPCLAVYAEQVRGEERKKRDREWCQVIITEQNVTGERVTVDVERLLSSFNMARKDALRASAGEMR